MTMFKDTTAFLNREQTERWRVAVHSIWCSVKRHEGVANRMMITLLHPFFQNLWAMWKNEKSGEGAVVHLSTSQQRTQTQQLCPQPAEHPCAAMDRAEAGQGPWCSSSVCLGAAGDLAMPAVNPTHGLAEGIEECHLRIKQNRLLKAINNQKQISREFLMLSLSICALWTTESFIHHALGNMKWLRCLLSCLDNIRIYIKCWQLFFEHSVFSLVTTGMRPSFPAH